MPRVFVIAIVFLAALVPSSAIAQEAKLDGAHEQRARALFHELRCVVCQNQSIDGSQADVARDLRKIVREQITAGKTDGDIRQYLVARYGEFVLLKPRFAAHTILLWLMPIVLLLLGGWLLIRMSFKQPKLPAASPSEVELNPDEQAQLDALVRPQSRD